MNWPRSHFKFYELGMDLNQNAEQTARASSDPTLTAYHQGVTDNPVDHQSASSPQGSIWTSSALPDSQSQDNLRQASVALDAAYERITQLRNSINNMLNRMPPEVYGPATSNLEDTNTTQTRRPLNSEVNIRPPHSAIVLSGGERVVEELNLRAQRLRSLISPNARQRLEEYESGSRNHGRRELVRERFSQGDRTRPGRADVQPAPLRPHTSPMPDLIIPRAHNFNFLEARATLRRDLHSDIQDDSNTMIGRRVAARLNANADGSGSQGSGSTRLSLSRIEQRLQVQTAQIARELENMTDRLASQRSRRVELALSSGRVRGANAPVTTSQNDAAPTFSAAQQSPVVWPLSPPPNSTNSATASPLPPLASRPPRPPTGDVTLVDNITLIAPPEPASRSSSHGTVVESHTIPVPVHRSLSAAYREHVVSLAQESARELANAPEVRGTLLNFLTGDRVNQFNWSRHLDSARPGGELNGRDSAPRSTNPRPQPEPSRRPRWINADGDEVDTNDEESTHARRLRMRLPYGTPSTDQTAPRSEIGTIEDILWQISGSLGSDSEADALSPEATGNAESCHVLPQGPLTETNNPRFRNPLPTPLEEMLVYLPNKPHQPPRVVRVSKYASLAGR
ncbi:hypothetical protein PAXRUDRAFT_822264 [Paxillus rubicundulus Ve08.2h10]|uniref:Uncharacterized protein n=1 Tax=Paxillus rubicundulus Ve08.2h10 TaxID=930991 RepID=A0A0D0DWU8_9AGAM|nr:hypothetical protein PAXRUDRAFT_822264 [Paxillus rubicundulus Ve08.2h10]